MNARAMPWRTLYMLVLFTALNASLMIDKAVMVVITEPVKHQFNLSDTQVGLVTGTGFAVFFALASIPFGRLVDRGNRRNIVTVFGIAFSVMTSLGGLATTYFQLLMTRILVGTSEAAVGPAMLSMLSDVIPKARRASAFGLLYIGPSVGSIIVFVVGGYVAAEHGWRAVFFVTAVPGIVVSILVGLTLREPVRGAADQSADIGTVPFRQAARTIWKLRSLCFLLFSGIIASVATVGCIVWLVSFLIRSHGMGVAEAGHTMAISYGLAGMIGVVISGMIVDKISAGDVRRGLWFAAMALAVATPALGMALFARDMTVVLGLLILWALSHNMVFAPTLALCQTLVHSRLRGTVSALWYALTNLASYGFGPPAIGWLSDELSVSFGAESLRYALLIFSSLYLVSIVTFLIASRRIIADMQLSAAQFAPAVAKDEQA